MRSVGYLQPFGHSGPAESVPCLTKAGALTENKPLCGECEGFPPWWTGTVKRAGMPERLTEMLTFLQ